MVIFVDITSVFYIEKVYCILKKRIILSGQIRIEWSYVFNGETKEDGTKMKLQGWRGGCARSFCVYIL